MNYKKIFKINKKKKINILKKNLIVIKNWLKSI